MFLIFHELRADVLPVGDIGLQRAIALHYHDGAPHAVGHARSRPRVAAYRSVATWYLWRSLTRFRSNTDAPSMEDSVHPYAELTPDRVLGALESVGFAGDGRLQALGSYENRVYLIGIEDAAPVVA